MGKPEKILPHYLRHAAMEPIHGNRYSQPLTHQQLKQAEDKETFSRTTWTIHVFSKKITAVHLYRIITTKGISTCNYRKKSSVDKLLRIPGLFVLTLSPVI